MEIYTFAAIDIGSNAARLLIKNIEMENGCYAKFNKILFLRFPLRLGDDVFTRGIIGEVKADSMLHMIKAFKQLMYIYNVKKYRACATSAMREAKNGEDVIRKITKRTGIDIEIINGREEAKIIYGSHIENATKEKQTCGYVDVGGGSTEVTLLHEGKVIYSMSYNIGTIRMLNMPREQVDNTIAGMKADLSSITKDWGEVNIVGSGGNINRLYKQGTEKKKKLGYIGVQTLADLYSELKQLSIEDRINQFSFKRDRADVIVPAAELFLAIAESIHSKRIYVPTLGLADGIIDSLYMKKLNHSSTCKSSAPATSVDVSPNQPQD